MTDYIIELANAPTILKQILTLRPITRTIPVKNNVTNLRSDDEYDSKRCLFIHCIFSTRKNLTHSYRARNE